jgi:hypothetical protein
MKIHRWEAVKGRSRHKVTSEQEAKDDAWVRQELVKLSLKELRAMAGKTQTEVAGKLRRTQSQLSKLERQDDALLSTLREYVKALGGDLELVARFGDRSVRLRGV